MNKKLKSGLLLLLLVGPLLFWGVLHIVGTNHYKIPTLYPINVSSEGDTIYHKVSDFNLINQNGEIVTLKDYDDKLVVANFFFTSCPTICPKISNSMKYLQYSFRNHDDVMFLSHTVDPETDSVPVLKKYAELYEANDEKWNFVTGDREVIYMQARESYKIIADINDGLVHSEKLVLIDKNKNIRGYFDGTNEKEVEDLLSRIRILLYEQSE